MHQQTGPSESNENTLADKCLTPMELPRFCGDMSLLKGLYNYMPAPYIEADNQFRMALEELRKPSINGRDLQSTLERVVGTYRDNERELFPEVLVDAKGKLEAINSKFREFAQSLVIFRGAPPMSLMLVREQVCKSIPTDRDRLFPYVLAEYGQIPKLYQAVELYSLELADTKVDKKWQLRCAKQSEDLMNSFYDFLRFISCSVESDYIALRLGQTLEESYPKKIMRQMHQARVDGVLKTDARRIWKSLVETREAILSLRQKNIVVDDNGSSRLSSYTSQSIPMFSDNQIEANGAAAVMVAKKQGALEVSLATPFGEMSCFDVETKETDGINKFLAETMNRLGLVEIQNSGLATLTYDDDVVESVYQITDGFPSGEAFPVIKTQEERKIGDVVLDTIWRRALLRKERVELGVTNAARTQRKIKNRGIR